MSFKRTHHQHIAQILAVLNGELLKEHNCLFGGGTAIALMYGEYRESVDIDFLISDLSSYRNLRNIIRTDEGIFSIMSSAARTIKQLTDIRADQYGIRTKLEVSGQPIKFEIILEGRIELTTAGAKDEIMGIATLTKIDMATSKLLAISDRWADASVHSRDVIDLAMLNLSKQELLKAIEKAKKAYGMAIESDLSKAVKQLKERDGLLSHCIQAMDVSIPQALLWQNIRKLTK